MPTVFKSYAFATVCNSFCVYCLCVCEREIMRERERLMKVIFVEVHLGDSNRQPQPSLENLESRPILPSQRSREREREREIEIFTN